MFLTYQTFCAKKNKSYADLDPWALLSLENSKDPLSDSLPLKKIVIKAIVQLLH